MEAVGEVGHMLEGLGISREEEAAYRALLRGGRLPASGLARSLRTTTTRVRDILSALERKGLVSRSATTPATYSPAPPTSGLEVLVLEREQELRRARDTVQELADEYTRHRRKAEDSPFVEVVPGIEGTRRWVEHLQRNAKKEFLILDKPPYPATGGGRNDIELELLQKGIRYRTIYDRTALEWPGQLDLLQEVVAAGEEARVMEGVPLGGGIVDRQAAILPVEMGEGTSADSLLVRESSLLDALVSLFERMWAAAQPLRLSVAGEIELGEGEVDVDEADRQVLVLLVAGLKEETIARQMHVNRRTVQRRISGMIERFGVTNRVQLAVKAARMGLV